MAISPVTFGYVHDLVREKSAIVLAPGKEYLVESRLAPLARAQGFGGVDELATHLARTPFSSLHRAVVEAMTTNETTFFRDVSPFESLRTRILPQLIEARRGTRTLNLWSAACSSGQEPYTVAMILKESFPELAGWRITFTATDLSTAVLARARAGRYSQLEINRGLPAPYLVKYFTRDGLDWCVADEIRHMVDFRELNLAAPWPPLPRFDLILLRNVLIYFDVETKRDILRRARETMAPDGFLMLGSAETTISLDDNFIRADVGKTIAYQLAGAPARGTHVGV